MNTNVSFADDADQMAFGRRCKLKRFDSACAFSKLRVAMIIIRATDTELEVSGSSHALRELATALKSIAVGQSFQVPAEQSADPKPYVRLMSVLEVVASGGPVRVSIDNQTVRVTGSPVMLETFASFFDFSDEARLGEHNHHDWWEGNEYVAPDSRPLVIAVI